MSRPVDPRLVREVPALRRYLAVLAAAQFVGACLVIAQALLLSTAVVTVFVHHQFGTPLTSRLVALGLIGLGRAAISATLEATGRRASLRIRADLRSRTLRAITQLGPSWARRQDPGRLVHAAGPGLDGLDGYLTRALPALVSAGTTPSLVLLVITLLDWQSGLLLLVMLPLVPVFMALVGVTTKRRVQRQYVLLGRLAGQFLDLLRGLTTLRIYGQAERQEQTLRDATERYRRETMAALRITFLSALVLDLVATLSVAVIAVDIGVRLDGGSESFATALAVLLLAPEVFAPLRAMGAQFHANEDGVAASGACLDVIAEAGPEPELTDGTVRGTGEVALRGVSVQYAGRDVPALDRVHLAVHPGERVILEGPSGAGKSTVMAVLLGYAEPDAGAVLINGTIDLGTLDIGAWRQTVAWVPQRPNPTQQTVAAEVRLGDPSASDAEVAEVCKLCRTPEPSIELGEDGRWVSAGQRRRIALARALLRARSVRARGDVPLVLLDEPSEDLDESTELVVANVLESLTGWATVVVATHSPVLAAMAQRRVMVERGRIVGDVGQVPARHESGIAASEATSRPHAPAPSSPERFRLVDISTDRRARRRLLFAAGLSALAGLAGLALTGTSTWLISRAAQHPNLQALSIAVVGVRTFALARALLRYLERLASHDAALHLLTDLRVQVFSALRRLGSASLAGYGRGDLLRRFARDVDGVQDGLVRTLIPLAGAGATALGAVVVVGVLAPSAAMALAAALAIGGAALPWLALRAAGEQGEVSELIGHREAANTALIEGLDELVAYGADGPAVRRIGDLDERILHASRRQVLASAGTTFLAGVLLAVTLPVVVLLGAHAVRSGRLPVVDLAVLAVCVLVGFEGINGLPAAFASWAQCRAGLARVGAVVNARPSMRPPNHPQLLPSGELSLYGNGLSIAPAPRAADVLHDVNLRLEPGLRVAITGPSGCGKSTLLAAVMRQLPVKGELELVDDAGVSASVADVDPDALPAGVAGSLQGDHVFDATLRDNLRVVRPEASDADLSRVATRAGLGDFVDELPGGWNTPVGADGTLLSGGQRQRLLIARALLAAPAILVLDEPTAHLDADTERGVLRDLLDATSGQTVLLTTHRREAAAACDDVIRIVDGTFDRPCVPQR